MGVGEHSLRHKGRFKILGLTTTAFFLTFVVWFNMAPFTTTLKEVFDLSEDQISVLMLANVALAIPARVIIGMLVDRFGPRNVFTGLLLIMSVPCFVFALSNAYWQLLLSRVLLAMIGAGFVVGIRMVSEWFPPERVGFAEGIYGGWGNFGSAAAAMTLPTLALLFGGENGWRYAIGFTGLLIVIYAVIYYNSVRDTPEGVPFKKSKTTGAMQVTSYSSLAGLIAMTVPMYGVLALIVWKLHVQLQWLTLGPAFTLYSGLLALLLFNIYKIWTANREHLKAGVPEEEKYSFRQVAILDFAYLCTFGSELAVVSMLPAFFEATFSLQPAMAGVIAGSFAFMNLMSRPSGGWFSDRFGRKITLIVLLIGLAIGYLGMAQISSLWPIWGAVLLTMVCSFFVQAGEGAVFAMVPLVKKNVTGQVAGMVGAYGNVGSVGFLTVLSFVGPSVFYMVIGGLAIVCMVCALFLREPGASSASDSSVKAGRIAS